MSGPLRLGACATALSAVLVAVAWAARPPAAAPGVVTATSPAAGATLTRAPIQVDLAFSGPVDIDRSHVWVRDSSGASTNVGGLALVGFDRIRQRVNIGAVGDVTVTYHVTFGNGTQLADGLQFRVNGLAAGPDSAAAIGSESAAVAASGHRHGIDPISAVLLALDGVVALAVVGMLMRRPRSARPSTGSKRHARVVLPFEWRPYPP
jgi:methionine-rich copper-binding protein CopC